MSSGPTAVGESFYCFGKEILGPRHELRKHWVTEISSTRYRHRAGGVDTSSNDTKWPGYGDPDPKVAFRKGKKACLASFREEGRQLRKKLQELLAKERKFRSLKFSDVAIRGNNETFEQFQRNWDLD